MDNNFIDNLTFDASGLIPAIAQDVETKEVLMLAYMNRESLDKTIKTGKVHYYSRSRQRLWLKGETSGNFQIVKDIMFDCDSDALLLMVEQVGSGACHTGNRSCFYRGYKNADLNNNVFDTDSIYSKPSILYKIYKVIADRKANPVEGSYTNYLLDTGIDKVLKKVGEEASEVIIASKNRNNGEVSYEVADLMYHLSVLLFIRGITWNDIFTELQKRR